MSHEVRRENWRSLRYYLIEHLISKLIVGMVVSLIFGLTIGMVNGLIHGLKEDLEVRSKPNQGIWNSLQNCIWTTIFSFSGGMILFPNYDRHRN